MGSEMGGSAPVTPCRLHAVRTILGILIQWAGHLHRRPFFVKLVFGKGLGRMTTCASIRPDENGVQKVASSNLVAPSRQRLKAPTFAPTRRTRRCGRNRG